jgi:hypothetical protein
MKNIFYLIALFFSLSVSSQHYMITFVNVPAENEEEFINIETEYWANSKKANIDAGNQLAWGFVRKVGGNPNNSWTHAFINVFESAEKMTSPGVGPSDNLSSSLITNGTLSSYQADFHWVVKSSIPQSGERLDGQVTVWNFARPKNIIGFINENNNLWKPFFENNDTGRISWGVGLKLNPRSNDLSTVMTWDGYPNIAEALNSLDIDLDFTPPRGSKMDEYDPDGWTAQVIVQDIMWLN